ncbi:hypothetical protein UFOVP1290_238 [uncultured Caudovirales phage]|uniref:Uncharacterized protein n=1 Tax=uncultured Caudovirales phage TaxID=2100421 RepID=A0A6J5RT01_9CAUD|nr:hypothetical protein UFOVP1290_238 [uncultured Caudovirales phage]
MKFFQDDQVRYVGTQHAQEFRAKKVGVGIVIAKVGAQDNAYVCEFGDDAYVMPETSLMKFVPTEKELKEASENQAEVVVTRRRKRTSDEDE